MTFTSPLTLTFVCMLIAMLIMIFVIISLLASKIKVKNGEASHYWTLGSLLSGTSLLFFYLQPEIRGALISMLVFGAYLLGHLLHWRGLQIFFSLPKSRYLWQLAGLTMLAFYAALDHENDYQLRMAAQLVVSMVVWSLCLWKWIEIRPKPFQFVTYLGLFGLSLMIVDVLTVLMTNYLYADISMANVGSREKIVVKEISGLIGLLIYMMVLIYCYFERYVEQMNYAAVHDDMTGLFNRRAILERGQREIEVSRRSNKPLAIALVDVDNFKKINDRYGHAVGDLVLKQLADVLQKTCRSVDLIGRYGGEEFCLILPGNHHGNIDAVADRIVKAIREHDYRPLPSVTISIGISVLSPVDQKQTWRSLVKQADRELYKVKQSGRDNYSTAAPDTSKEEEWQLKDNENFSSKQSKLDASFFRSV